MGPTKVPIAMSTSWHIFIWRANALIGARRSQSGGWRMRSSSRTGTTVGMWCQKGTRLSEMYRDQEICFTINFSFFLLLVVFSMNWALHIRPNMLFIFIDCLCYRKRELQRKHASEPPIFDDVCVDAGISLLSARPSAFLKGQVSKIHQAKWPASIRARRSQSGGWRLKNSQLFFVLFFE